MQEEEEMRGHFYGITHLHNHIACNPEGKERGGVAYTRVLHIEGSYILLRDVWPYGSWYEMVINSKFRSQLRTFADGEQHIE